MWVFLFYKLEKIIMSGILPFTHSGKDDPATEHATVLSVSVILVHLSMVPSVQVLFWFWRPGPHEGYSPVAWHDPIFFQGPCDLETVCHDIIQIRDLA